MKRWLLLASLVPVCLSCSKTAAPAAEPPAQAPEPVRGDAANVAGETPLRVYQADWGASPSAFVDVRQEGYGYSWLYDGGWRVSEQDGEAVLEVPFALQDPPEPLTFRRYDGTAFGPGGALPVHYRIRAEARSLGGSMRFRGYGELAIQVCYFSPTRYVEVLQTDQDLLLWQAQDAPPGSGKGWKQLAKVAHATRIGEWLSFGAEVDRASGRVTALLDGHPVAQARVPQLATETSVHFTLRATGNQEQWRSLVVEELP